MLVSFYLRLNDLLNGEQGQDLIEYALMMVLISLALISGINGIAVAVNTTFTNISTSLA
ncbi:MAG: Flp family type IVb pilin [Terracidiphilus sp.]